MITLDDKTAQQVLEALETVTADVKTTPTAYEAQRQAIEALRQAIEQSKQEPVAWMYDWEAEGETVTDWLTSDYDEAHSPTMRYTNIRPLYTAPPKREWVGLTEDERKKAGSLMFMNSPFNAAVIAIENRLQEKNT